MNNWTAHKLLLSPPTQGGLQAAIDESVYVVFLCAESSFALSMARGGKEAADTTMNGANNV